MNVLSAPDRSPAAARPWRTAIVWLAFLGPFFLLTYGWANAVAARRSNVPSIVFAWERHVPFLAWTIVPYWSIDVFYAMSVFVCASATELAALGRRLVAAQIIAVVCFVAFPLRFVFDRPATHGAAGVLFAALTAFDRPFNQAPSLHVALLVILWPLYASRLPRASRWPFHVWFALIGASVLTTYQHHFIDVPTGVLLGVICLWLWPIEGPGPFATRCVSRDPLRLGLAIGYGFGGALCLAVALRIAGAALWLIWPAVSLLVVAANYALLGPAGFQKNADGRMSLAACMLLAPYLAAAFINSRSWTWREPAPVAIADGVWLGRLPLPGEAASFSAVVDLCAELPAAAAPGRWTCVPMLDLVAPAPAQLREAATRIERSRTRGPVLVCCALGYSRGAATIATWLMMRRAVPTVAEAIDRIRTARPAIVIDTGLTAAIAAAAEGVA